MNVSVEIVDRYNAGERDIPVGRTVFYTYWKDIVERKAFLTRLDWWRACPVFNKTISLAYRDARVRLL